MVDVSPVLSTDTSGAADSAPADTQLAEAGATVTVSEPQPGFTTIQLLAPDEALQLAFDPAAVAKAEIKDGNLEITFDNGGGVVIQGYEAWAQAGGQATGPQGGAVDMAQLMRAPDTSATTAEAEATPQVCAAPSESAHVVQVPVPAAGERMTIAPQPGDMLQLACSFRDVAGKEVGDTLEMTFPGGGVVVVENFSAWAAAEGATITDCVCGGVNLAEFIVALGLVPEDVLPAAGEASSPQGGPQGDDLTGSGFTPGPGPQILSGYPYPHILPPTQLGYGVPEPEQTFFPVDDDDLGSPDADDDGPGTDNPPEGGNEHGCVDEEGLGGGGGEGGEGNDLALTIIEGNVLDNDSFGPDGEGDPKITEVDYLDDGTFPGDVAKNVSGDITTFTGKVDGVDVWVMTINTETGEYSFELLAPYPHAEGTAEDDEALERFQYTIQDFDGDTDSAVLSVCIEDDEPIAYDNEQCVAEQTQNFVIIADVSGSMDDNEVDADPTKDGFQTRLELEISSLLSLLENLAALNSGATVTLIAFAAGSSKTAGGTDTDGAIVLGTFSFGDTTDPGYLDAVAAVNSLAIGMNGLDTETEYDDALLLAQQVLESQLAGQAPGTLNTVFFLSDGVPNPSSNDADATDWQSFVDSNGIEVVAVGIGGDVSPSELAEVEDNGDAPLIVDDQGDLAAALNVNVGNASVSGNVLTDPTEEPNISPANDPVGSVDDPGADGLADTPITQLVHNNITYTIADADGAGTLTITTGLGGTLEFNFLTGDYTYTAPASVHHGAPGSETDDEVEETFQYTIQDADGDTDPANLVICIQDGEPIARDDTDTVPRGEYGPEDGNVISGVGTTSGATGADTLGPDGAKVSAVANAGTGDSDSTADGGSFTVDGLYGVLTINEDGSYSYLRDKGTPGGVQDVFTYTLTDGDGDSDTATLTITIRNDRPTVDVPTAGEDGTLVNEKGLPARGGEPEGSGEEAAAGPNGDPSETTTGSITFADGDGPATVTIGGVLITTAGQTIVGDFGTLTITGIDGDSVEYSYTLKDNTSGDNTEDDFAVVITDKDNDKATGTLVIDIVDDVPTARNDTDAIPTGTFGPATGNVITSEGTTNAPAGKDTVGADDAEVTAIASNNVPANKDETADGSGNFVVNGQYGVLTINEDGSYSYQRNAGTKGGVSDVFTYTLTDGDGDVSTATLTIDIGDDRPTVDVPVAGEDGTLVDEKGLPARAGEPEGSGEEAAAGDNGDPSETTAGVITFTQGDGPATVTIDGVAVTAEGQTFAGLSGTLTITSIAAGSIGYSYTLKDNTSGDGTEDDFAVVVTDQDGDTASGTLVIDIVDDVPTARNDTDSIGSGQFGPAVGNVITSDGTTNAPAGKDTVGADDAEVSSIASNNVPANKDGTADVSGDFVVQGQYGVLTINEDGSYSYQRNQGTPGGVQDVFTYTLTDGDGDKSSATLTIDIGDDTPTVDIPTAGEAGTQVFEKGLPARGLEPEGSGEEAAAGANGDPSETTTGTITFADGDGPATVTIDGVLITAAGQTITGAFGTLTITAIDGDSVDYSYTLEDNTSGDNTEDDFAVVIADKDGDTAAGTLVIDIVDDVPTARNDTDTIATGTFGPATGNVITDVEGDGGKDTVGADNALVTKVGSNNTGGIDEVAEGGSFVLAGQYGVLTLNQDGTYSYLRNQGTPGGVQDVFTYTLTDGDGDVDTATLTISIGDDTPTVDIPTAGEAGTQVFEKGLPARNGEPEGSGEAANPAPNSDQSEITTGSILLTDGDGPAKVTIGGVVVDSAGDTVQGAFGVLEITGIDGDSVEYKYTLSDNTSGDATKDTFAVEIADKDGDKATGNLVIDIVDDVPTAVDDADSIPSGQFGPATGNVITDAEGDGGKDTVGADNALVTKVSSNNTGGIDEIAEGGNFVLAGQYGVLTLNQDGTYSYLRNQGTPGGVQDVFTYTLTDGDGDVDTATLTISIGDDTPTVDIPTAGEAGTVVFEKGLPARNGEPEGSGEAANPAPNTDQSEITTGSILFTDGDGPAKITIGGVVVDSAGDTVQGAFGVLEITGIDGDSVEYKYTLSDNTSGDNTKDTFAVEIADKDGDKATGSLVIDIVDDVPTANDDADSVGAGGKATGNVITGAGTTSDGPGDDVVGADNAVVTDIDFGLTDGTVGGAIAGNFGTLVINADGSYEYQAKANVSGTDVFTYTLTDGDGDTETATLTINVGASTPVVNPATDTVDEAALDQNKDGKDLAAGTATGSNPSSTDETETGTLVFSDPDGALISKITFNGTDFSDAGDGSADGFITVNTPLGLLKVNTASGDYTYTLEDNSLKHNTQGTGIDGVNESFTYTVTDGLGNTNSSSLVINIQDDVPTANDDTDSVGAGGKATGNVITGAGTSSDGPGDDVLGADGAVVTDVDFGANDGDAGKAIAGNFGTLVLNADGSYEYQAKANVSGTDVFTYTLTDGDGDIETATLTINVADSKPTVNPATDTVDEAALDTTKSGNDLAPGTTTGTNPSSTDETETGTLVFSDADGASISKITFNGSDFTDAGDGSTDGFITVNTPLGLLKVDTASGNYTYTLEDNSLKHSSQGTGIDGVNESFTYTVTDKLGNSNSSSLVINIQDDVPIAVNDTTNTAADEVINIVIVFDRSGSMDENPGVDGYSTRIDLARAAVTALLETYGSIANVNVMVVDFANDANHSEWGSIADALAYLAALEADGTTNYAAAINETMGNFDTGANPLPDADRSLVYFVSDGKPNPATTSLSSQGLVDDWEDFLEDNEVEQAFAIGVGNGIPANDPDLEDVAYKDANNDGVDDGNSAVVVTDDLLLDTLVSTVGNVVNGNVLTDGTDDRFGADERAAVPVIRFVHDGVTFAPSTGPGVYAGNTATLTVISNNGVTIVLATAAGGLLTFTFSGVNAGQYTYEVPNTDTDDTITYTIADGDGDTATATLTLQNTADPIEEPNTVFGDNKNNNLNGQETSGIDIIGGDDGNDTASGGGGDDHITGGAGTDNLSGGSGNDIIIGGSQSQNEDQTIRAADGADTIDGGDGNDFIVGNQGNDVLGGGLGADTILGGAGADQITGGRGNDSIDLSGGGNDVVRYTSTLDGHDVIAGFDSNNDGGTDQLNLDALFDALGVAAGDRAARVQIDDPGGAGGTVEIRVDTNGDSTFDLDVATITTTGGNALAVGTEIIVT